MTGRMILAGLALCVAFACGGSSTPTGNNSGSTGDIQVGNNFFRPTSFPAATGATVTWFWSPGGVTHNIVFDDNAPGSGDKSSGTFARTFPTAGNYPYHCSIHGAAVMSGTVTVGGGGAGGGGGGTPTGGGGYDDGKM